MGARPSPHLRLGRFWTGLISSTLSHGKTSILPSRRSKSSDSIPSFQARRQPIRDWFAAHRSSPYATREEIKKLMAATGISAPQVSKALVYLRSAPKDPYTSVDAQSLKEYIEELHGSDAQHRPLREWIIAHRGRRFPTGDALKELATATNSTEQYVRTYLSMLRRSQRAHRRPIREWLRAHVSNPYPTPQELDELVTATGFTEGHIKYVLERERTNFNRWKRKYIAQQNPDACATAIQDSPAQKKDIQSSVPNLPDNSNGRHELGETHVYHCTVCTHRTKTAQEWRTHEFQVHGFRPVEWVCMLGLEEPHPTERVFWRKERLQVHAIREHHKTKDFQIPASWARPVEASQIDPRSLWCGFCETVFESIEDRMAHVGDHFRVDGADMANWRPRPPE